MANNKVQVSLAFTADTKQAKQQIDQLQASLTKLTTFSGYDLKFGDNFKKEVVEASQSLAQLQTALHSAINQDTGKIDLSKFNASMKSANMTINDYVRAFKQMGPEGEKAFEQFSYAIQGAEIPLRRTGKLANELWTTLKNTMRWQLSASVIQGFTGAVQKAYGYAQDLNESLNNIRIVTNASVEDMARFAIEANKSAKALSTTTTEYTNASLIYYQQGLSTAEVKERTDVTIKMANVARESAETISDQMTAVWNNFDNGSKSLEYYADVMTALGAETASSTAEITTGLEKFAAVAETVGLSYEYATTALATITDTTRQSADVVGNALKTLFARIQGLSLGETLEDGTDLTKYSEALAKVGISIKEQDGSLKEMDTILDEMANKWGTLAKDQQVALAQTVAGVRQYTQLVALMDNWDKFQKNLSVAQNAEGTLQKQADIYAESWEAARERVQASLESIYHDLLNDEFFIDLNDGLAKTIGLLDQVIDNFGGLKGIVAGLGVVFTKVFNKQLVNSISNITFSLKQRVTGGANEIALKNETATAYQNWVFGVGNEEDDAKKMSQQRIGQLQKDLLEDSKYLTEEAIKQRQLDIDRQKILDERVIASARELDIQKEITGDLRSDMSDMYRYNGSQQERQKANKLLDSTDSTMTDLTILQTFKALPAEVKNSTESLNLFKKVITETFNINPSVLDNNLNDVDKTIQQLEQRLQNLKQQFVDRATQNLTGFADESSARATLEAHLRNQGMAPDEIEETVRSHLQFIRETRTQMEQEFDNYTNAMGKQFGQQIKTDSEEAAAAQAAAAKRAARNLDEWKQGLVGVMQGVSQVTFGIQSLIAINDVLNNQDLEWHEKTLSIIQSLAFGLPSVINGLALLGDSFKKLKDAHLINSALVTLSKNSKIASLGLIQVNNAGTATITSLTGLGKAILKLIGPYALLAAAVMAVFFVFKQIEAQKPENQLKKVQEEAVALEKALNDTKTAAERLKNEIEGYESAVETLDNCVKGTEEWEQALKDANTAALELLKNNPELYGTGAVKRENGRIIIDDEAYKELQNKQESRQNILNGAYASKQKEVRDIAIAKEWSDIEKIIDKADYKYSDEADAIIKLLERQYSYGDLTVEDLYQYKDANNPAYSALLNDVEIFSQLENAINELSTAVAENTIATEIESEQAVEGLLNNKYTDAVVKGIAKSYDATVKAEKEKFTWKDSNAELFELYRTQQGISSSAIYSASENKYTINGTEYEITRDAMIEALSVANAQGILNNNAKDLQALLDDENSKESRLISEGINSLSAVELNSINKETLDKLVDLGAIEQTIVNQINSIKIDPDNITLEDTLSADLQQTFVNAFGKNWANEYAGNLIKQIPQRMRDEFAQAVAQTNWSDVDSAQGFHDLLAELGGWMPEDEIEGFIQKMMDANDAVKQLDLDATKESFYSLNKELDDLEEGGTISAEVFASLTEEQQSYFTLMGDGTYMLTEDAKEFYELVRQQQLDEVREKQQQVKGDMDELKALYDSYQNHGAGKNLNNASFAILQDAGWEYSDSAAENAALIQEKIAEYEKLNAEYEKNSEFLQSTARSQQELKEELEAGNISEKAYEEGLKRLNAELKNTEKSLKSAVGGMGKYAPELEKAMTALTSFGEGKLNPTEFGESIKAAITAVPEFTGAIWSAYSALTSATPGTEEYTAALATLQTTLSEAASSEIMAGIGEVAESTFEVLDDELASTNEQLNAIANLNAAFGADIFGFDDVGIENLNNLRDALNQDEEAWMKLQQAVAKGIMIKYGMTTDEIDAQSFFETHGAILTASEEIRNALIACGLFEVVDYEVESPIFDRDVLTQMERFGMDDKIDGKYQNYDGRFGNPIIGTDKRKISLIKPLGSNHNNLNGSSSGGSSKSSSKPSTKTHEKDKFHVEKKTVADLEKDLERLEKQRDHAFGEDKRSFLDSEIEKAKELQSEYAKYQAAVQAELATAKTEAINVGAQIDPTSGAILNYNALMEQFTQEYNAAMAKAGDNDAAQEAAEKRYDTLVKTLETYYELYDLNEELIDTIYDLDLSVHSKELETISLYVEQVFDVTDDELKYIDWMMTKIENRTFSTAQQLTQLLKQTEPLLTQGNSLQYAFGEIDKMISQEGWTDEIGELGDNTVNNAYSVMEALLNLKNNAMDKVTEGIDEQSSALDQWISRWDNFRTIVSNMDDIFGLLGEKFVTPEMEATIDETDSQLALDKLKGTKSDLDYWTNVRDSAKEQRDAFAEGTEEYEKWDKIYRDALVEQEKCQADLTAAWKETLEAITTQYENSVDRAIAEAEKGITGFKSLEEAQKALDQQMKDKELFLEDFERAHELSNLTYDINKAMNDLSNSVAKNNMAKLLDDIAEYEKEGVKMTEYELEVLQKKFEIEQARADLEAAKTAMSQVRLTRDDEGNWSYQYTADQDKIDEATRSFEDKMYELEKLSREHIDETTATILELEQEMFEEIKNLNIKDFKDVDEFNAAKQKIIQTYTTRVKELYGDIGLAIETVNGIYGTEEITFAQTTAGITSGAKSQDEAIQNFKDNTVTASEAITGAAQTYQEQVEETFPAVGTTVEGFSKDYNEYMDGMTEKSQTLVDEVEGMSGKYSTAIDDIMREVRQWQQDFGNEIDLMIQKLEDLISKYNEAKSVKMNVGDGGGPGTTTEEVPEPETEDIQTDNTSTDPEPADTGDGYGWDTYTIKKGDNLWDLAARFAKEKPKRYPNGGASWKVLYDNNTDMIENAVAKYDKSGTLRRKDPSTGWWIFPGEVLKYNTGGYTGAWGPEGRLAMLHQKELVLNPDDTENFLAGINILREITRMIDLQANAMASPMGFAMPFASHGGSGLEQNVHISASFPGVQDRNEIEIALRSLVNEASQFVLE